MWGLNLVSEPIKLKSSFNKSRKSIFIEVQKKFQEQEINKETNELQKSPKSEILKSLVYKNNLAQQLNEQKNEYCFWKYDEQLINQKALELKKCNPSECKIFY